MFLTWNFWIWVSWQYGLWVFQTGETKLERFLSKNQLTKIKWLNFGSMASCQKVPKFDFQSQFSMSKITWIFLNFFHWRIPIQEHIFCYCHFLINHFWFFLLQNDALFLIARHWSKTQNSIISFGVCWFLCKTLSNFVPPDWKLYNLYCHY